MEIQNPFPKNLLFIIIYLHFIIIILTFQNPLCIKYCIYLWERISTWYAEYDCHKSNIAQMSTTDMLYFTVRTKHDHRIQTRGIYNIALKASIIKQKVQSIFNSWPTLKWYSAASYCYIVIPCQRKYPNRHVISTQNSIYTPLIGPSL